MGTKLTNLTIGVIVKLFRALARAGWTIQDVVALKERASDVLTFLRVTPPEDKGMSTSTQLARWVRIYREKFGLILDPETIHLPYRLRGFDRLVVVAVDDLAKIFAVCQNLFGLWLYRDDLAGTVSSVRTCESGAYAVWVRNQREADRENRDQPAQNFERDGCVTLHERILFEIAYFLETGQHLDEERWTICAGSRGAGGGAPRVCWSPRRQMVFVGWYDVQGRDSDGAVRAAVA
ncbi:MAG: hypothetical protein COU10_01330 [Candidatus Harrisonbacteria bacterium CG10_big_fil_rev_8_21_14_0_10_45_28]|uniref:Uncharacterized protein n=1 Tax=Candidatus Harrisonbacteria bacterium CG10_big_fil_rev_8_21_14_0_10_45_28 TaxID=1974586 RepID=A0A2H0UQU2_9BACT|nr:MAG: hypothetical protein COU10_01330 [Candidatus Harrisonbacteria bacterium CG10_big_fil_rev_8_21_14_0_10_45_28]